MNKKEYTTFCKENKKDTSFHNIKKIMRANPEIEEFLLETGVINCVGRFRDDLRTGGKWFMQHMAACFKILVKEIDTNI